MNPILQSLATKRMSNQNNIMGLVASLKNGNPDAMFAQMMNTNPQFKAFVENNKGKTPEQIARENGIDTSVLSQFMR